MKTYLFIKRKDGQRQGNKISSFVGNSLTDSVMLKEVELYLRAWLEDYNNSLTIEEVNELFSSFDGSFNYDVWSFTIEQQI